MQWFTCELLEHQAEAVTLEDWETWFREKVLGEKPHPHRVFFNPMCTCGHRLGAHLHQDAMGRWTVQGSCTYAFGSDDVLCGCEPFRESGYSDPPNPPPLPDGKPAAE